MTPGDRRTWLMERLRDGAAHRAEDLAREVGVTARTIYRDMAALAESGLPVAGERGLGYVATAPMSLPPLALEATEAAALTAALGRLAGSDDPLASAAAGLLRRIGTPGALPLDRASLDRMAGAMAHLAPLSAAIRARQKVEATADRSLTLRPLALDHWAGVWTLVAWSETDGAFRDLPLHRIAGLRVLPELFIDEPGRRLADRRRSGPGKDEAAVAPDHQP